MAGRKRTILFDVIVDDADARRALGRLDSNVTKTATTFGKAATAIKYAVGAVAGRAILGFAQDSISAASDLEESMNKVDVIFGDNADVISDWAQDSATSMGISNAAALEAAGTYGAFFDALGVAAPQASEMSMKLVELAADMASFNNQDPTEMLTKLQSGLAGEVEPLRKFGVDLSAASVEAKALEMGLADVKSELTQGDKVLARYQILLEQTATAQGDFARTSDGAANAQRILRAELENTKAQIGEDLLPVYAQLISALGDMAPAAVTAAKGVTGAMNAIWRAGEGVVGIFDEEARAANDLWLNLEMLEVTGQKTEDTVRNVALVLGSMAEEGTLTQKAVDNLQKALGATDQEMVEAANTIRSQWLPSLTNSEDAINNLNSAMAKLVLMARDTSNKLANTPINVLTTKPGSVPGLNIPPAPLPRADIGDPYGGMFPGYATGGVVPGPVGQPQMAVVHGGEEIIPANERGGGGGVTIHNLNVKASWDFTDPTVKRTIVTSIQDALTMYGSELGVR